MSDDFSPSPRASKRRRTTRYGTQRTTLVENGTVEPVLTPEDHADGSEQHMSAEEHQISTPSRTQRSSKKASTKDSATRTKAPSARNDAEEEGAHCLATPTRSAQRSIAAKARSRSKPVQQQAGVEKGADRDHDHNRTRDELRHKNDFEHQEADEAQEQGQGEEEEEEEAPQTRSSRRQRKKPARYAEIETTAEPTSVKRTKTTVLKDVAMQDALASPLLKGILTPSKRQKTGHRKSVMFDQDDNAIAEQFGFKDIDTPAKTTLKRSSKKHAQQANEPMDEPPASTSVPDPISIPEDDYLDPMLVDEVLEVDLHSLDLQNEFLDQLSTLQPSTNQHLTSIKKAILSRLTSASSPSLKAPPHLNSQYQTLHTLLTATVTSSESNSVLLLGPRGTGKSHILRTSLANLAQTHGSDLFHTVHLSGFLQTDDRLALRDIWRQLGREMNVDETETEDVAGSYADTMASLLSLLSHPDEMAIDNAQDGTIDPQMIPRDALGVPNGAQKTSKSIIFILDEFDLFTTHPRQTLLYNLFDIAQSRKAPIAVVGCSTRMDVIECLEKRVKSRFSHRWLLVPGCRNLVEWEACVKDTLLLSTEGKDVLQRSMEEEGWVERWNRYVTDTFLKSDSVQRLLKIHFYATKSLPNLYMALYPLIATLDLPPPPNSNLSKTPTSTAHKPPQANASLNLLIAPPSILSILPTLPTLHLSLLISCTRLTTIHSLPAVNFNLVHTHYTELIARSKLQQTAHGVVAVGGSLREWSRETCKGTWEELGLWGVMVPVVGWGEDGAEGEETRMWRVEVGLEEVEWGVRERFGSGGGEVLVKWCREV